jgi:hypothetical protein
MDLKGALLNLGLPTIVKNLLKFWLYLKYHKYPIHITTFRTENQDY